MNRFQDLENKLNTVEKLAQAGKFTRFLHNPFRYVTAQFFRTVIFPLTHKGTLRQANTFMGYPLSILLPAGTDIYLTGGKTHDSEIRLARFLIWFYQRNQHKNIPFVDIGAHIGFFSLLVSFLTEGQGQVASIEAAKGTFDILLHNLKSRSDIKLFNQAMTNDDRELIFYEFPVLYSEYNTMYVSQFEKEKWFQKFKPEKNRVKGMCLDSFITENQLKNPLIKIDTEGAEAEVIEGAKQTLEQQSLIIIMEFLADDSKNKCHFDAFNALQKAGYSPFYINEKGQPEVLTDIKSYLLTRQLDSDNVIFAKHNTYKDYFTL